MRTAMVCTSQRWQMEATGLIMTKKKLSNIILIFVIMALIYMVAYL